MERLLKTQLHTFGGNIRRLRSEAGLTQDKLAELTSLNIRTIQKIEAGETNILVTTAARIQHALKCPWDKLMTM